MYLFEKIPVVVLHETPTVDEGVYTFVTYDDVNGPNKEYVKNFILAEEKYGNNNFVLDYSVPGKVSIRVNRLPAPVTKYFIDLKEAEGVTTEPKIGMKHYVEIYKDFKFTATFSGTPWQVKATGYYTGEVLTEDNYFRKDAEFGYDQSSNTITYYLRTVVEHWTVEFLPGQQSSVVANDAVIGKKVWTNRNTLYINANKSDVVSIYNMTGVLYKKVEVPDGLNSITLDKGIYVVTLADGSVHKIVVR